MARVFVSHASVDEEIVSLFVDIILCSGSGLNREDIFFTSREDTGVLNGDDIPSAIKDGISCCEMFFMMVSEAYRKSEVCLNEMGAAWMRDDLPKKVVLLPGVGFNSIGWLMSLNKGTKMTDEEGLDAIHDQVMDTLSIRVQTSTWNRFKKQFMKEIEQKVALTSPPVALAEPVVENDDEELDFIDYRERFDSHMQQCGTLFNEITNALSLYNSRLSDVADRLSRLQKSDSFSIKQVRSIMGAMAYESDLLSEVLETNSPLIEDHFATAMESYIMLQKFGSNKESIKESRRVCQVLINSIVYAKDSMGEMKDSMDSVLDLDKTFSKSKKRLKTAIDGWIEVMSSCIRNANEIQIV